MKQYADYHKNNKREMTKKELASIVWTKFKIIVPTQKDKKDIVEALKYLHDTEELLDGGGMHVDITGDFIPVNQLVHAYREEEKMIVVDKKLFASFISRL
jgi:hypothetical protein